MFTAIFSIGGGKWATLQTVAWTKMLYDYSSGGSFVEALTKTFDGLHPCNLCETIQQGQSEEKSQTAVLSNESKSGSYAVSQSEALPLPRCRSFAYPWPAGLFADSLVAGPPRPIPILHS